MESVTGYKITRPDSWDFYTGKTINYRKSIGKTVKWAETKIECEEVFTKKINIASANPNDCFFTDCFTYLEWDENFSGLGIDAYGDFHYSPRYLLYKSRHSDGTIDRINCSAYRVQGVPEYSEKRMWGFRELEVIEEVKDLNSLFGWNYYEVIQPVNPFKNKTKVSPEDVALLRSWLSVREMVRQSTPQAERQVPSWNLDDEVTFRIMHSLDKLIGSHAMGLVMQSVAFRPFRPDDPVLLVWNSPNLLSLRSAGQRGPVVKKSVEAIVYAYIGSLFPNIMKWYRIRHKRGRYPFEPAAKLWRRGLVPSFDGIVWRSHSGKKAEVVYEEQAQAVK